MPMIEFGGDATEVLQNMATRIRTAISSDAADGHDAAGGTVACLTSSVMGVTAGLLQIAHAINNLAEAVRERE